MRTPGTQSAVPVARSQRRIRGAAAPETKNISPLLLELPLGVVARRKSGSFFSAGCGLLYLLSQTQETVSRQLANVATDFRPDQNGLRNLTTG
jgi:hypothetical protein